MKMANFEEYLDSRFQELLDKEPNLDDDELDELDKLGEWFDLWCEYAQKTDELVDYYGYDGRGF